MEKLKFEVLSRANEIDLFLNKVENYSSVRLPVEYIKQSKIVGVFLQGKMVAGYMLVTSPGFRSLMFVPDRVKNSHYIFKKDTYEFMEVNGLWIGPALKTPKYQLLVWAHLIKDIFFSRKKYILLLRNLKNQKMQKFTGMANPVSIYEGTPQLMGGEMTHDSIEVSYTTRWKIVLNAHQYFKEYFDREKRASKFAKQHLTDSSQPESSPIELA